MQLSHELVNCVIWIYLLSQFMILSANEAVLFAYFYLWLIDIYFYFYFYLYFIICCLMLCNRLTWCNALRCTALQMEQLDVQLISLSRYDQLQLQVQLQIQLQHQFEFIIIIMIMIVIVIVIIIIIVIYIIIITSLSLNFYREFLFNFQVCAG